VWTSSYAKADNNAFAQNCVEIDKNAQPVKYNRMIFGQFVEHFHRQIYGGIVPEAGKTVSRELLDEHGFRKDVIEALKELKIPIVRYPDGVLSLA
jgi:alpha-N-arabinofuranosidase